MTPNEVAYLTHWLMTASAGFLFLLCGFAIHFFTRNSRTSSSENSSSTNP